jgi:hypothetical protein
MAAQTASNRPQSAHFENLWSILNFIHNRLLASI